jgi:hypothetical protein
MNHIEIPKAAWPEKFGPLVALIPPLVIDPLPDAELLSRRVVLTAGALAERAGRFVGMI